ncbi:endonuclease/exonuclease/phosphatase family protein [Marinimicrococcus flavescens]|uniref:Endonuclease/exonuclease/phosphatase family protein n=1 Tax=Marinimicrococcus flavescens TaxID=3031815 RepID=A0AAP3UXW1_9PROT|nr:endonuclease/exonuclease/phosphatase family protein [Marinimicrococcus flavescens]
MRHGLHLLLAALAIVLVGASVLPALELDLWFVRMADFPRLQMLVALAALAVVLPFFLRQAPRSTLLLLAAVLAAGASHALTLWPYRPGGADFVESCPPEQRLSVMVANVLLGNREAQPLLELVRREKPDILLAMETDAWWHEALAPLEEEMPFRVQQITGSYYGLELFSRLPLIEPEIRRLADQDTPAVQSGVRLRSGERIDFVGLHPHPPRPWQPAIGRDAQLYAAALLVREDERPAVVAGDLNSTPWETALERMQRIGALIDPRQDYGYAATYSAHSWWRSWPLDHVLHEPGFATSSLHRLGAVGSDHYPYLARLCRMPDAEPETPPPLREDDLRRARATIAEAQGREPARRAGP